MQSDRIGKYRIIAKLGQGGMATVYLSIVPGPVGFNKLLVVKVLKEELSQDPDFLSMFLNEARLAARLNHANVVHTYEVGVEDSQHFLVMDYLDGQPLHSLLRRAARTRMPLDVHVRILADALAGLHYAHTLTDFDGTPLFVVHRDVSPQNVFVTYDGQVKVVDFGIAKAVGAASTTQSGVFKGKLAYVAPEQAGGDPVDARSDIFSIGVMLWEAIAARRFAQGDSQTTILAKRLSGTEPRIREAVPDADPELAEICDRAMAQRPNDRFPSALAFRDALEGFLDRFSRRVGAREVGELISSHFAEERAAIRKVIDEQMKRVMRETAQALPLPTLDMHGGAGDSTPYSKREAIPSFRNEPTSLEVPMPQLFEHTPGSPSSPGTLATALVSQPPAARSNTTPILIGLSALALASAGGVGFILLSSKDAPGQAPAASVAPAASSAPAAEKITISIAFGPSGATAKLDGVPLTASPFVAQVPRDGWMHRLEFGGEGLETKTQMISYDKDLSISVDLAPQATASASASAPPAGPGIPGGRAPAGGPTTGKDPKQPREIDEQDPYKK
jgi:serine/threonine-protein kinase